MKTKCLVILFFFVLQVQAQVKGDAEYLVRYDVAFVLDSLNAKNVTREVHRLYTGTSTSYYISEATIYRDSLFTEMRVQPRGARGRGIDFQNMPSSEFHAIVYKDLIDSVWVQNLIARDSYQYQEPKAPVEWKFTTEIKQIGEYEAIKATTSFGGRDYEAWFTLEIPILDGPYVFSGLPGLILELYDTDKDYHFFLSSLVHLKEKYRINSEEANSKQMTKEEFVKFYKRNKENPVSSRARSISSNFQFKDRDGRTITSADLERRNKEAASKRNNQIENW